MLVVTMSVQHSIAKKRSRRNDIDTNLVLYCQSMLAWLKLHAIDSGLSPSERQSIATGSPSWAV